MNLSCGEMNLCHGHMNLPFCHLKMTIEQINLSFQMKNVAPASGTCGHFTAIDLACFTSVIPRIAFSSAS